MNKKTIKIAGWALGLSMAVAGIGAVAGSAVPLTETRAEEKLAYTLAPAAGSNNSYAGNCDIEIDDITWNVSGNSTLTPWRLGGKSLSGVAREIYSKNVISEDISKIVFTFGAASSITVNSFTVIVDNDSDFTSPTSELTPAFVANSTVTVNRPAGKEWANSYYKFIFNVSVSSTSNKFLEFSGATFSYSETTQIISGVTNAYVGDNVKLSSNADSPSWSVVDEDTTAEGASVSSDGLVSVSGPGTVKIKAEKSGYTTAYHTVTFASRPSVPFVAVDKDEIDDAYTEQNEVVAFSYGNLNGTLNVVVNNGNAGALIQNDDGEGNAEVNISFVSAGSSELYIRDGETTLATITISIAQSAVTSFVIDKTSIQLYVGDNETIVANVEACGVYDDSVAWTSSDSSVASVSDGVVSALKYGTTTISATASDGSVRTCSVAVTDKLNTITAFRALNASINLDNKAEQGTSGTGGSVSVTENGFTLTSNGGYIQSNAHLRVYKSKNLRIIASEGKTIKQIDLSMMDSYNTGLNASYTSLNTNSWTVTTSAQVRITSVTVSYIESEDVQNTNFIVQRDLLDYVRLFNTSMACEGEFGNTLDVQDKWAYLSDAFETLLEKYPESTSADNRSLLKKLVTFASSAEGGDLLQDMLARYDYIITKYNDSRYNYNLVDFLHSDAGRAEVHGAMKIESPRAEIVPGGDNLSVLTLAVGLAGILVAGGFFFVQRKRKED